jgi:hypothetical protein
MIWGADGKMKTERLIVSLLFLTLSVFLVLTPAEYVQCRDEHPDECFDVFGVLKHPVNSIQTLIGRHPGLPFLGAFLNGHRVQCQFTEGLTFPVNLPVLVLSTVLLRE